MSQDLFDMDAVTAVAGNGDQSGFSEADLLDPNVLGVAPTDNGAQSDSAVPGSAAYAQAAPPVLSDPGHASSGNESGSTVNFLAAAVPAEQQEQQVGSASTDDMLSVAGGDQQPQQQDGQNVVPDAGSAQPAASSSSTNSQSALPDMYGMSSGADATSLIDDTPLREYQAQHAKKLEEKRKESQQKHQEILAKAEHDLKLFLEQRSEAATKRAQINKENEKSKAFLQDAPSPDAIWSNVAELVDFKSTTRGQDDQCDISRMRDLLATLKHQ
mmetsp:Transcript_17639/g.26247  ORF Transcript_17639/g.26247 Transcript_17639/m.26247 type:complete len:271 (+) Transcript_17639:44-856(+)|eukprot:CAMPEP_0201544360 /NCGR_PEP_ID=MMETSP0173_2-20130828/963_1 /ASSEMBLY_ACC=CAM_ASM_000268 /TAXON_ID=218659 /ORGANISM="Vexillifera sp., Strain DIVA3 564/2" /LENGTH=270 /DNA_ID=CAMNT_0047952443 /DNA_START=8 /DNA_END=820 /DNA_ORIENTATION=-